jgi:hypothetical protein
MRASSSDSWVPVSSQAWPRPITCTSSAPALEVARLRSVISSSPRGEGLSAARDLDHAVVVEIQPGHRVAALGLRRLFFQADARPARRTRPRRSAPGRHRVGEHRRARGRRAGRAQHLGQVVAVEDVVAQHQRGRIAADEVAPMRKACARPSGEAAPRSGCRCPTGCRRRAAARSAACPAAWRSPGSRGCPPASACERVVDHRLVVDRQQLLGDRLRDRVQPRAGTAGEDDALAFIIVSCRRACRPRSGLSRPP